MLANRQRHAWLELANQITDVRALSATRAADHPEKRLRPLLQELALPRPFRFIAPSKFIRWRHRQALKPRSAPARGGWQARSSIQRDVLVRNERCWGRKPALQQITIKVIPDATSRAVAFETGEIDMLYGDEGLLPPLDTFERFRHHPGYVARLSAPAGTVMLALNASQGPTREQAVREALNYAVDKQTPLSMACCMAPSRLPTPCLPPPSPHAPQDLTPRRYDPTKSPRPAGTGRLAAAGASPGDKSRATVGD
ncbi:ABC transporter substrate-binding protein [Klebsiella pneumoniae subsp. pneumoniae]|nr:ABC transporter substrate-binding protein [Klebsiella pneumoniae subsp. pneumoniae]